jgi:hypothetical protein
MTCRQKRMDDGVMSSMKVTGGWMGWPRNGSSPQQLPDLLDSLQEMGEKD